MESFLDTKIKKLNGLNFFRLGIFFLPSTALFSGIFLLISTIFAVRNNGGLNFRDKWNYPFIFVAILMLLSCINAFSGWLSWVGLANWIPLFWCFCGFQPFLNSSNLRKQASFFLLAGTVPVLITGFGQLWFDWAGPWQLMNGLVIWFVSPGGQPEGRLSGLFDYANIAAAWLVVVWPFSLASLISKNTSHLKRFFAFVMAICIAAALVLTDSRNGWGGLVAAIPFVFGLSSWKWLLPLIFMFSLPIFLAVLPGIDQSIQEVARGLVPKGLWTRLTDIKFIDTRPVESTRLSQWKVALDLIKDRPLLGWGAAAFSVLYPLRKGLWHGHSHNLPLELAVSHGVLVSLILTGTILFLLIKSLFEGVVNNNYSIFDRAWWTSAFLLVSLHATDIPMFDSRINLVGWILIAGIRSMIKRY